MGQVYLGEHVILRHRRAVKLVLPAYAKHPNVIERFFVEAKAIAALRHRNVVAIDDIGQLDDGTAYLVLEYLEGGTLAGYLASLGGPMASHAIVHVLGQVCAGLQAAHDLDIVHRDLKPENIFLTDGAAMRAVIIDFGVARLAAGGSTGVTRTGAVVGTPQYMAPEQQRGERVGPAADVYALGAILYEMCTGGWMPYLDEHAQKGDFVELTASEIYHRQMTRPPFDPRRRHAGVSDALAELMLATLSSDPARRPASPRAFALALAERVPSDGFHPDGLEVLRTVARPLIDAGDLLETVRSPRPAASTTPTPAVTRFELGKKLGAGGMAEVWLASTIGEEGFSRPVAIKRVLPGFSDQKAFAEMFSKEAKIMSRLDHPNIVSVISFDKDPEGHLFLAMEFVDGRDLAALAATGPLPVTVAIFIAIEALQGLGYAHDFHDPKGELRGVVHRDISPHNILLGWSGAVKVSDFGIAAALSTSGVAHSITVKGKIQYMAPEQIEAAPLDGRCDLFAMGVVLWEVLTGRSLVEAGTTNEMASQMLFKTIPLPSSLRPIPRDVERVTMRLLERDASARYPSAEAAIEELARCADAPRNGRRELSRLLTERFPDEARGRAEGERSAVRPPRVATSPTVTRPTTADVGARGARRARRWRRIGVAVCAILAFGAAGAGIGTCVRRAHHDRRDLAPDGRVIATPSPVDAAPAADATPIATAPPDAATPVDAAVAVALDAAIAAVPVDAGEAKPRIVAKGDLVISVVPYAEVWIDGVSAGTTPIRKKVPVGPHRVLLVNNDLGIQKYVNVTVGTEREALIEESW
ncbi:MAG: serine/threonine protein kinase [Deltaproteobacteria bacterium]|nr:serine/threonine protein kinase [Deltaproteobacteria bacterium]